VPAYILSKASAVLGCLGEGHVEFVAGTEASKRSNVVPQDLEGPIQTKRQKVSQDPVPVRAQSSPSSSLPQVVSTSGLRRIPSPAVVSVGDSPSSSSRQIAVSVDDTPDAISECPEELRGLDPRIQEVLRQKPAIIQLLRKHPAVLQNFNKDNIARLGSLLKRSQDSEKELAMSALSVGGRADDEALRTVTIYKLPPETLRSDVEALFDEIGDVEVTIPVESRKRKHVGIAHCVVETCTKAREAVRKLDHAHFRSGADPTATIWMIRATMRGSESPALGCDQIDTTPVSWKSTDELWEVHIYNKDVSVDEACQQQLQGTIRPCLTAEARSQFQEAARRERQEQARLMQL